MATEIPAFGLDSLLVLGELQRCVKQAQSLV